MDRRQGRNFIYMRRIFLRGPTSLETGPRIAPVVVNICRCSTGACARRFCGRMRLCSKADRAEGMEVLRRLAEGRPWPRRRLVGGAAAERHPAGGVRDRDGRARRRRATRRSSRRSARVRRRDLCAASGAQPDSSGGQRESRRPHGGMALRPAHRGLRAAAGHGAPRGSDAHQRPHRRARF